MGYRIVHNNSTACYLKKDNKVLMIKFYGDKYMLRLVVNLKLMKHLQSVLLENFMKKQG